MKFAICDDNVEDLTRLKKFFLDYQEMNHMNFIIDCFQKEENLLASSSTYHCYILDVVLTNTIGIELAKTILKKDPDAMILFISSYLEFSTDAFKVPAFRYILKPIEKKNIFSMLDDVMKHYEKSSLLVQDANNHRRKIYIDDILYVEAYRKGTLLHMDARTMEVKRTVLEWQGILNPEYFKVCCRGILVNIKNVDFIDHDKIILRNKKEIYASRKYVKSLTSRFYQYVDEIT